MTEERAFDIVADPNYFGTMLVQDGRRRRDGVRRRAHDRRHDPARRSRSSGRAKGTSVVSSVFFMCLRRPRARLRRLRRQSEARPAAARGHRDQLGRDGGAVRRRAADRDALLLDRASPRRGPDVEAVREATEIVRERRPGPRRRGADPVRRRRRRERRAPQAPGERGGRAGDGARLPRPRHRATSPTRRCSARRARWRSDRCCRACASR